MSRPDQFLFLFYLLCEALASRFLFLFAGTFRRRIPEPEVQVSRPDAHHERNNFFLFFLPQGIGVPLAEFFWLQLSRAADISSSSDLSLSQSLELNILELRESRVLSSLEGLELQAVDPRKISLAPQ
ncbi:hypothetical protein KFK09_002891 [Dendrobium nobile]|uniref:Uncharacterized protein n=1 Tax=Dendrobium nobile TaxID=94219 RepID=A0A8T3C858_DENNO|nr:hypothetical protein KFK09_002891 [Dendrobium nobile]